LINAGNSGIETRMKIRSSLYSAAMFGALYVTMLAGPASADIKDPQANVTGTISQGMRSVTGGDFYSQGMMAVSGPWEGEIYSQGMMMPDGQIYSQGTEITMAGATTNSPATDAVASQACVGTAPNCTDNVTNTPPISASPSNQPLSVASLPIGVIATASADPVPEPASLALLAAALLWLGLVRRQRSLM
jgi:hypothetical protein